MRGVRVNQGAVNALGFQGGSVRLAGLGAAPGAFQMQRKRLEQAETVSGLGAAPGAFQVLLYIKRLGLSLIFKLVPIGGFSLIKFVPYEKV